MFDKASFKDHKEDIIVLTFSKYHWQIQNLKIMYYLYLSFWRYHWLLRIRAPHSIDFRTHTAEVFCRSISQFESNKENLKYTITSQVLLTMKVHWLSFAMFLYCKFAHMKPLLWAVQQQLFSLTFHCFTHIWCRLFY